MADPLRIIEVTDADLPLHCPTTKGGAWDGHPRVFLPVGEKGEALCPYCGALYRLRDWDGKPRKHH